MCHACVVSARDLEAVIQRRDSTRAAESSTEMATTTGDARQAYAACGDSPGAKSDVYVVSL